MPTNGFPVANAMPLAVFRPISSDEARPGPYVAAMASICSREVSGFCQRLFDHGADQTKMVARCEFGYYAAIRTMQRDLGTDDVGQDLAAIAYNCGGSLVAGGFDTEHVHSIATRQRSFDAFTPSLPWRRQWSR